MKTGQTPQVRLLLKWLRETRKANGLSMRKVAHILKLPYQTLGKIENGERRLDVLEYSTLCKAIGADVHEGLNLLEREKQGGGFD